REDYPSISVSTGHVTSLRKVKGELKIIQLDASLNPGNSGGPVLDEKGRVVAVVRAGIRGAAVNFAQPVNNLTSLLDKPEVSFDTAPITYDKRGDAREFSIKVVPLDRRRGTFTADLILDPGSDHARTFPMKSDGNDLFK